MKKQILFLLFINSFFALNAQSKYDNVLIHQQFISTIGYICEETPEPNHCAGLDVYLILSFTKEHVSIIEKEISSCGTESITSKLDYKWELTQNSEIKIYSNPKELEYNFLKDLVIKLENKKVIGYKKRGSKKMDTIEFEKIVI